MSTYRSARSSPRSLLGKRRSGWALAGTIVALLAAALAPAAEATIFDPGEKIGKFKILGGHLDQTVSYFANYRSESPDGCYYYNWSDQGTSEHGLKFDRGERAALRFRNGAVYFFDHDGHGDSGLEVHGKVRRTFSSSMTSQAGPSYNDDCGLPPTPPDAGTKCGTKKVKKGRGGFSLGAAHGDRFAPDGRDAILRGLILHPDPLKGCASTSIYANTPFEAGSKGGLRKLDSVRDGPRVTLSGRSSEIITNKKGFAWPFGDWVGGSQQVSIDWKLKLRRLSTG